jgi:hypothetical protein
MDVDIRRKETLLMSNTFHVAVYVTDIPHAVEQYRKMLGIEPAKVRHDYAKFELADPPVIFSLNVGGEPGTLSHIGIRYATTGEVASEVARAKFNEVPLIEQEGTTCCYAKADKFWMQDSDGIPWEMYTLLADAEAETAADQQLRNFLGQKSVKPESATDAAACCAPSCCAPEELTQISERR